MHRKNRLKGIYREDLLAVYAQSPIPTMILDGKDSVVVFNSALAEITGYTYSDIADLESWLAKLCSDEKAVKRTRDLLRNAKAHKGDVQNGLCTLKLKDLSEHTFEISVYSSHAFDEENELIILKMIDISERTIAEKALQQSEERYKYIFDYAPISIWEYDCSELFKRLNQIKNTIKTDFGRYFDDNPAIIENLISLITVKNINRLHAVKHKHITIYKKC